MSLTNQQLTDIDWILSDLSGYRFDDKTKQALKNACYIVRQLNGSLGGNATAEYAYDVLNLNYLATALDSDALVKPD